MVLVLNEAHHADPLGMSQGSYLVKRWREIQLEMWLRRRIIVIHVLQPWKWIQKLMNQFFIKLDT